LLRKDPVGRAVVELLAGFIDLQAAGRARSQALENVAQKHLQRAAERCRRASEQRERSDDLRLYLALLEPRLARAVAGECEPEGR